ncbi:fimbria/pilus periplasmic chaperone, partial [Escherichia coli]
MFNLTNTAKTVIPALALLACFSGHASVTPDRTRLVFNESDKSISVTLRNNDPKLPYLA